MPQNSPARQGTSSSVHLDAIRGAAALIVLLGHTRDLFFSSLTGSHGFPDLAAKSQYVRQIGPDLSSHVTIGNEAVIIFFVLSGFLVGGSAIRDVAGGTWSWKKYMLRRATRLWIVLIPALLFGVAVDFVGLHLFAGGQSIYSCAPNQYLVPCNLAQRISPAVLLGNALFLQTIFVDTAGSNNALWSLANEFWYYLAFPMCLLTMRRGQPLSRRLLYLAALPVIGLLVGKRIFLLFLVWVLGAVVSMLPLRIPRRPLKWLTLSLSFLFPLGFVLVRRAHLPRYLAEWIVSILFSALLYVLLHRTAAGAAGRLQGHGRLLLPHVLHAVSGASSTGGIPLCQHQ